MSNEKITVISTVNHEVTVVLPQMHFQRTWQRAGAKQVLPREIVDEMMFDPGAEYMLRTGILYIEDMEVKKEIDLEPEDAKEPVNVIVFSEKEMVELLTKKPAKAFKEALAKLNEEQLKNFVAKAVEIEITNAEKGRLLKEASGVDVMKAIEINKD